jgi:hypothetical protein
MSIEVASLTLTSIYRSNGANSAHVDGVILRVWIPVV